jgi:hypothetical protein
MPDARVQRRLAAILAANVAGYSRLMGNDEVGTLAALKASHRDVINPKLTEHRGRNTPGDSVLIEFASAVDATQCAVEIQKEMAERNSIILEDHRVEFRIGINVGDIIVDNKGDIYGDGVNIAARIESLARPEHDGFYEINHTTLHEWRGVFQPQGVASAFAEIVSQEIFSTSLVRSRFRRSARLTGADTTSPPNRCLNLSAVSKSLKHQRHNFFSPRD